MTTDTSLIVGVLRYHAAQGNVFDHSNNTVIVKRELLSTAADVIEQLSSRSPDSDVARTIAKLMDKHGIAPPASAEFWIELDTSLLTQITSGTVRGVNKPPFQSSPDSSREAFLTARLVERGEEVERLRNANEEIKDELERLRACNNT